MDEKRDVSLKNAALYNFDTEVIKTKISKTKPDSPPANSSGKRINKIEIGEPFNFRHVAHCGFDGNFDEDKDLQPTPSNTNETEVTELKLSDIIRSNLTDEPNSRPHSTIVRHSIINKDQISLPRQFRHLIHIGTLNGESPPPASMHKVRVDGVDVYFNDESYSNLATKIHKPVFMGEERYVDERKPNSTLEQETLSRTTNELQHEISSSLAQAQTNKQTISSENIENSNSNPLQSIPERPTPKPRRLRQAPPPPQTEIKPPEAIPHSAITIKPPEAIPHSAIAIKPPQEVNKPITKPPLPKPRTKLPAPPPPQTINSNPIETINNKQLQSNPRFDNVSARTISNELQKNPSNLYLKLNDVPIANNSIETINNKQLHSNPTFDSVSARTTSNELQKNPSNVYLKLNDAPIANKEGNHPPRLYEASHVISQRIQPESPTIPRQDMPDIVPRKRDPSVPDEPRSTSFEVKSIKPPLPPKSKKPPLRPVIFDDEPEHDPEPDEDANEFSTEPTVLPMGQHYGDVPSVRSLTKRAVQLPSDVPQKLSNEAKYLQNFQIHDSSSWPQRENDNKKNEVNRYENVKQVWEEIEMEKTSNATPPNLEAKNEIVYRTKQPSSLTAQGRIRRTKSLVLSDSHTEENKLERAKIPVRL